MNERAHRCGCFMLGLVLMAACTSTLVAENVVNTVRLINGKNGKPIKDEI